MADGGLMATILELAREVRHRLVSKDTGCLTVDYPDAAVSINFRDGTVATERPVFMSCFARDPVDFEFKSMEVEDPGESGLGASLLIEAIEAIEPESLLRVWKPYADWKIGFRMDPDIHNTLVKQHLQTEVGRLRRLMRLAVSGSVTLEPPKVSITDEIEQIEKAFEAGNWRQVLGVDNTSVESEIKQAYRKLARRFHPDRWVTSPDMKLRDRIERTFQSVSRAYTELQHPRPITPRLLKKAKRKKAFWERMCGLVLAR